MPSYSSETITVSGWRLAVKTKIPCRTGRIVAGSLAESDSDLIALRWFRHIVPKAFWRGQQSEMSFRFRKRIHLFPGAWINLSKKGGSLSFGGHGLTENISRKGSQETVSTPGTGLGYRTRRRRFGKPSGSAKADAGPHVSSARFLAAFAVVVIILWIIGQLH
jgi:Protein of unknown function (DUF4236)